MKTLLEILDWLCCFVLPEIPRLILLWGTLGFFIFQLSTVPVRSSAEDWKRSLSHFTQTR